MGSRNSHHHKQTTNTSKDSNHDKQRTLTELLSTHMYHHDHHLSLENKETTETFGLKGL